MTFSDIKSKVYFLTSTNSTSLPDATMAILANNALERVVSLIMQSDGRWQWEDTNNTDLPIATTALVSAQQDYTMAISHLELTRVEVLDSTSNWHKLIPIDQADVWNQSLTDFMKENGLPTYYDKIGNSIFLYPAPNYSQSASLKLYFKRGPSYFVAGDTNETPGFNTLYHDLVPLWVAYDYSIANGKANSTPIFAQIQAKEQALQDDYSVRDKDDHTQLRARYISMR